MTSLLLLAAMFSALFIGQSLAVTSCIIPPIRSSGPEAAVIFVPGASIDGKAYEETGRAIQAATNIRLWVALTGNYTLNTPNPLQLPAAMRGAFDKLQKAGMKGENYVGVAHSLGGVFLPSYAKDSPLKAVVLLGSYLTSGNSLSGYPKPILTLSGELDGQTRITRIALTYKELVNDISKTPSALYRTPVLNIKGSNHAQFASGPMPGIVARYDLKPEISDAEAHQEIGEHVSNFISVTFNLCKVDQAKAAISGAFTDAGTRFQPLLSVKAMDKTGDSSPWSVRAQKEVAADLQEQLTVKNKVASNPAFTINKPEFSRSGDKVSVKTYTLIDYARNPIDVSTIPESPTELSVKLKSYDAIHLFLTGDRSTGQDDSTCKQLNELAVSIAFDASTPDAKRRYQASNRPIILADDICTDNGFSWSTQPLKLVEKDDGLHVQSVAMKVSTRSILFPGVFYCKLLSPYRAMEWMNVDSLREEAPRGLFGK
ncbi:uncharacterized protein LOC101861622 [Aplysia californica]|uniref:Uncharacterized protein LOC101861622 n=1 Tax=Aplysia californica TaxID=6500 RepID=A0ABM1W2C2_APLCA|nr:uncharacterized protein LOC101861622 [Aplysia californica]